MNHLDLSKRLAAVGEFVPKGAFLADIGSDHAYLPVALMLKGKIEFAVAGEVVKGPYDSAKKQVQKNGLKERIIVRLANGLDAIEATDQITTITIAGMGGSLIRDILEAGTQNKRLTGNERLILQPNIGEQTLRIWLQENQYEIIAEQILEENKKIYEIIVAEKTKKMRMYNEKEIMFGPILLQEKTEIFKSKWQRELKQRKRIVNQLSKATNQQERMEIIKQEIQWIEEALNEWQ
ncbi:tRNA (adenine(22)-N(1))-methyltransferase [Enterococcus villorum]|uniref:SAM-dependent methyltransferase n=2 Tax=Enterococcus villorum TaxID=112904 RepID=A0A511IZ97_9ENTE|nr:tRNA (adenine(22)-N(1))-methyltransferase TrmK [Enterococcus villorum]EOH87391.1 SAM-dependent methyltransferase [Enterococcus villorum ATCC 700913]EOW77890.1 SAM-dependent methyltransferase [Enterococcus villorum ATCC 700913]GEL91064.1 SAM-dependent methyltransferase [Enterococcus villorum]